MLASNWNHTPHTLPPSLSHFPRLPPCVCYPLCSLCFALCFFFCAYLLRILASYLHTQIYCGFSLALVFLALQLLLHLSHFCGCTNSTFRPRPKPRQDTRVFCPLSLSRSPYLFISIFPPQIMNSFFGA